MAEKDGQLIPVDKTSGFYDDPIVAPTVSADILQPGYLLAGWRDKQLVAVQSVEQLNSKLFGKTDKTFVAELVKKASVVEVSLTKTYPDPVVVTIRNGNQIARTVVIPAGQQSVRVTDLESVDSNGKALVYSLSVQDIAAKTESVTGGKVEVLALPKDLAAYAEEHPGNVQLAPVQIQKFTVHLTQEADQYDLTAPELTPVRDKQQSQCCRKSAC